MNTLTLDIANICEVVVMHNAIFLGIGRTSVVNVPTLQLVISFIYRKSCSSRSNLQVFKLWNNSHFFIVNIHGYVSNHFSRIK